MLILETIRELKIFHLQYSKIFHLQYSKIIPNSDDHEEFHTPIKEFRTEF